MSRRHLTLIVVLAFSGLQLSCSSRWQAPVSSYATPSSKPRVQSYKPIDGRFYKVVKGDTLYSIAWRSGKDYRSIARWNGLKSPYLIYTGQVVRVQPPSVAPAKTVSVPKKQVSSKKTALKKAAGEKDFSNTSSKKNTVKPSQKEAVKTKAGAKHYFKSKLVWRWPTSGKLTKTFKSGDDTRKGIVVSGEVGQSVYAAESGKVVYSGSGLIGYGQLIIIKHNNKYLSAYGYNRKILVAEGDWVTRGNKIAVMGSNDKGMSALHFEIRRNGDPINPVAVLPRRR